MFKWIYNIKAKLQEKLSQKGQGMTEYAIILAVVAAVAVAVFYGKGTDKGLEGTINKAYETANDAIKKVNTEAANTAGTSSQNGGD